MAQTNSRRGTNSLRVRAESLCAALGYVDRPYYFRSLKQRAVQPSHAVREALQTMGVHSVYAISDGFQPSVAKPLVYIACPDAEWVRPLRKEVWSQGAVPFILLVTADAVEICPAFSPPSTDTIRCPWSPGEPLPEPLVSFTADRLGASVTWSEFDLHRSSAVDSALVSAIEALNAEACRLYPTLADAKDLVNALIGKFIYLYALADRGIVTAEWLHGTMTGSPSSSRAFVKALFSAARPAQANPAWHAESALAAFDAVDEAINGSVFRLGELERTLLPDGVFHLVHDVIRHGDEIQGDARQLAFFDISFRTLRTETISAIYERFVGISNSAGKVTDGVFYTPPHLAEHVLDRAEASALITKSSRVLDPAAGSGIFLVGAYRRLMERNAPPGGWGPSSIRAASNLLTGCIFGMEKHEPAVQVCRFSLYLTLLDYVGAAPIDILVEAAGDRKFLPDLSQNVVCADAFAAAGEARFTHVLGNPPWSSAAGQRDRTNRTALGTATGSAAAEFMLELKQHKLPFRHGRLSDLFFWLAVRKLCVPGGTIALLVNTKSVVGRHSSAFAHAVGQAVALLWVGNFSHLRRKLFPGAEAPACLIVARNRAPSAMDRTSVYRPLRPSLPGGRKGEIWSFLASAADIHVQRAVDFAKGDNGWFTQVILSELDRRMHEALSAWAGSERRTLADFFRRSDLEISKGGSPAETGLDDTRLGPLNDAQLTRVDPEFRGFYSGNCILVPRSMKEAVYLKGPTTYNSTYNGIIPGAQYRESRSRTIRGAEIPQMDPRFVRGFVAYLNSGIFRYFASLHFSGPRS